MFLDNLFSRICSARGQFVIVVANQCTASGKHVALEPGAKKDGCSRRLIAGRICKLSGPCVHSCYAEITSLALNIERKNINQCLGGL